MVDRIYQISFNAFSMQTTLGGGKIGFLTLTVSPMVYATLSSKSFIKPDNPGPAPSIPMNTTGIEHTAIRYRFTPETELYTLLQNMDKSLNQQLLGAVEDIYVRVLKEKYFRYGKLPCLEVIYRLKANYYKITPAKLKLNIARMNAPNNINEPFKSIIKQIETAVDLATPERSCTRRRGL